MYDPPDDLLEDLQSALPPEQIAKSPLPHVMAAAEAIRKPVSPELNGQTSPGYDPLVRGEGGEEQLFYDRVRDGSTERYEMPPLDEDSRASTMSQVSTIVRCCICIRKPYHVANRGI